MQRFADLADRLHCAPHSRAQIALISDYLAATTDPHRGWAIGLLAGTLVLPVTSRTVASDILDGYEDARLAEWSKDYVGDVFETAALLWPEPSVSKGPPPLDDAVCAMLDVRTAADLGALVAGWMGHLDAPGRWLLLRIAAGLAPVTVSVSVVKVAIAEFARVGVDDIEEIWHGLNPPYLDLFAWLDGHGSRPEVQSESMFRPFMPAATLTGESAERRRFDNAEFAAEWQWDGVRVQISSTGGVTRVFSRRGDDLSTALPELCGGAWGDAVLDGELVSINGPPGEVNRRLGRKKSSARLCREVPVEVRVFDILFRDGRDLRRLALSDRRELLEDFMRDCGDVPATLSPLLDYDHSDDLQRLRGEARRAGVRGLLLKRRAGPYLHSASAGEWYAWPRAPLCTRLAALYVQRGDSTAVGSSLTFTLGAARAPGAGDGALVPVGKMDIASDESGFDKIEEWIGENTQERFGPVRSLAPGLAFLVEFDAVIASARRKSGIVLRAPRLRQILWGESPDNIARLDQLTTLIDG